MENPADGKPAAPKVCGATLVGLDLLPLEIETVEALIPMLRKPTEIKLACLKRR